MLYKITLQTYAECNQTTLVCYSNGSFSQLCSCSNFSVENNIDDIEGVMMMMTNCDTPFWRRYMITSKMSFEAYLKKILSTVQLNQTHLKCVINLTKSQTFYHKYLRKNIHVDFSFKYS